MTQALRGAAAVPRIGPEILRPRMTYRLFPRQLEALASDAFELLVGSGESRPVGASYLLRAAAIKACSGSRDVQALLLQRRAPDLRRDHLVGEHGLYSMLNKMQRHGFAAASRDEIRFANGSVLRWASCAEEAELVKLAEERPDVLLVDRLEDVPEGLYLRLRDAVQASPARRSRIIATTKTPSLGWIGRHWSEEGNGRAFLELRAEELDPALIVRPTFPSYRAWIDGIEGGQWVWAPHVETMVDAVSRWMADEFQHLAIFVPSQHGKTHVGPRHAIPFLLQRHPADWCSIASYDSNLAHDRSQDARELYARAGGELRFGRKKVREWQTVAGGGCWSAGTGAGQTGRPSTWAFIDDPDKDWEDAVNKTKQLRKRRWYGSTYRSRESMFAAEARQQKLCATVTRWDPGDLVGHALNRGHEAGERWAILCLPAIFDPAVAEGYQELYPKFEILADFRSTPGEPIWEERRNRDAWLSVQVQRGPVIYQTECQQHPRGVEKGGQFESAWFRRLDRDPAFAGEEQNERVYTSCCRAWDLGATEGAGDYTAGAKVGRMLKGGACIVRHVVRSQLSPQGVKQLIAAGMILDGPAVTIRLPLDPAAGGKASAAELVRYLREIAAIAGVRLPRIVCLKPRAAASVTQSAKAARARDFRSLAEPPAKGLEGGVSYVAEPWAPAVSNIIPDYGEKVSVHPELREIAEKGNLFALEWWTPWLQELESFTGADNRTDDQVDATVDGFEQSTGAAGDWNWGGAN